MKVNSRKVDNTFHLIVPGVQLNGHFYNRHNNAMLPLCTKIPPEMCQVQDYSKNIISRHRLPENFLLKNGFGHYHFLCVFHLYHKKSET